MFDIKRCVAQLGRALRSGRRGRVFESRHSDYLKEAEKSHFQGQYLEGAIFLWDLDLCRVYVEFMSGLCRIHAGFI